MKLADYGRASLMPYGLLFTPIRTSGTLFGTFLEDEL